MTMAIYYFQLFQNGENTCNNCAVVYNTSRSEHSAIKSFRYDLYAKRAFSVLNLQIDWKDDLFVLNKATGEFQKITFGPLESQTKLIHAHPVDGVFIIRRDTSGHYEVNFNAVSLNKFSLAVAYYYEDTWQFKYCIKITPKNGVQCLPLSQVFTIPSELDMTTALVLGIGTQQQQSTLNVRVFANTSGLINNGNGNEFNGYHANVEYNCISQSLIISDTLKPGYGKNMRFSQKRIYAFFEPPTVDFVADAPRSDEGKVFNPQLNLFN